MFGRSSMFMLLLAGTVAVPYVASNSADLRESAAKYVPALAADSDDDAAPDASSALPTPALAATVASTATASAATDLTDIAEMDEVFRLDVTPVWVMSRWTRVSTQLAALGEQGYRVPLVTGSREDDLAGALTYYFTPEHHLRRITFSGTTGDPKRFVRLLNDRFEFEQKIGPGATTFTYESNISSSEPSTLHIRPARVVRANAPHARFSVELEMHSGV
jgi:hypothetical protein